MKKSNSPSPQPRKNRLMAVLNAENHNADYEANNSGTKYLEFSLNESDHGKIFQSVRFSSPSQASPDKMKTPTKGVNYNFKTESKASFTDMLNDPNFGVKCLIAFLSMKNIMASKKLINAEKDLAFRNILLKAKTTVNNADYQSQAKKLKFYQAKCLELELENSKLKS
jgi:hypothetical protein